MKDGVETFWMTIQKMSPAKAQVPFLHLSGVQSMTRNVRNPRMSLIEFQIVMTTVWHHTYVMQKLLQEHPCHKDLPVA